MEENYSEVSEEQYKKSKRERTIHLARESLIVFLGSVSIIGFVVSIGFLIQLYNFYINRGIFSGGFEGNVTGLIIISIVCFLWTIQLLNWFRMEKARGGF